MLPPENFLFEFFSETYIVSKSNKSHAVFGIWDNRAFICFCFYVSRFQNVQTRYEFDFNTNIMQYMIFWS